MYLFRLSVCLLWWATMAHMVQGQTFARICIISEYAPVHMATYDEATGSYKFVKDDDDGPTGSDDDWYNSNTTSSNTTSTTNSGHARQFIRQRNLERIESSSTEVPSFLVPSSPTSTTNPSRSSSTILNSAVHTDGDHPYPVRECPCARQVYCPIEHDTCGVPTDGSYNSNDQNEPPVHCFTTSTKKTLLRNAWPLLLLWYSTIMFFLMCTEKGRHARYYILRRCCKSKINERMVDRFLFTHGFISTPPDGMSNRDPSTTPLDFLPVAQPVDGNEEDRAPTELVLKTRIYKGQEEPTTDDADHDEPSPVAAGVTPSASAHDEESDNDEHDRITTADSPADDGADTNADDATVMAAAAAASHELEDSDACCTICFSPLEVGDRVGVLACRHTFHVDCLREWLPRRNVCPLCQNTHAATPRYSPRSETPQGEELESESDSVLQREEENATTDDENEDVLVAEIEMIPPQLQAETQQQPLPLESDAEYARRQPRPVHPTFAQRFLAMSRGNAVMMTSSGH